MSRHKGTAVNQTYSGSARSLQFSYKGHKGHEEALRQVRVAAVTYIPASWMSFLVGVRSKGDLKGNSERARQSGEENSSLESKLEIGRI